MCLSHVWYYLFWLLRFLWHLGSWWVCWLNNLHYLLSYTNLFGIQKTVSLKKICFKRLLVYLPWPSRKQSTFFISSNSNLVFLTCLILSANTDPLNCVVLVFRKELNNWFLYFFVKSLFFAMLGILSTPPFCWLKWTALCKLSKIYPLLITLFVTEAVLEKCIQTVHVLVVETEFIQFL